MPRAAFGAGTTANQLLVGAATADITPTVPVALMGSLQLRIAKTVETPLAANVVALESRAGDKLLDAAVMVSCDLCFIPESVLGLVREEVHKRLPDLDTKKIFLNATHTHSAPVLDVDKDIWFIIPKGVVQVEEYQAMLAQRIADAIVRAWNARAAGSVTWGLGHAVVACNRRTVYADGTAKMYGPTDVPEFRGLEGYEDHDVGTLFFWNAARKLVSIVVNVSCPVQAGTTKPLTVSADFWYPVRELLHKRYGPEVCILGWIGAAGDQSPRLAYRTAADDRMARLRGLSHSQEIARRIDLAVEEAYEAVKNDRHAKVPLIHKVETIRLPKQLVTEPQYAEAKAACRQFANQMAKDPKAADRVYLPMKLNAWVVERFERQKTDPKPTCEMELHVLRIGDAAVCTNRFELFTEYGIRIKARSKAVQTFVVQLVGLGTYLPTEKAIHGGGYSATPSGYSLVGPEGGQILVDRTVELINSMWTTTK